MKFEITDPVIEFKENTISFILGDQYNLNISVLISVIRSTWAAPGKIHLYKKQLHTYIRYWIVLCGNG